MARGPRRRKAQQHADDQGFAATAQYASDAGEAAGASRRQQQRRRSGQSAADEHEHVKNDVDGARRLAEWAENTEKLDRWIASRGGGLEQPLLETPGRILRLRDYMPGMIADCVLSILEGLPENAWELSEQGGEEDAARHRFLSSDVCDIPALAPLRGVFWRLLKSFRGEPTLPIFSCGRYDGSDFIGRHDDRALVPFFGGDQMYSRTVAAIWYLTREWSEENGGWLVDLQVSEDDPNRSLVPIYNSLVVFEVPHMHEVTSVQANKHRYSIFGWWHQQGERYALPGVSSASKLLLRKKRGVKRKRKCDDDCSKEGIALEESSIAVPETRKSVKRVRHAKFRKKSKGTSMFAQ